MKGIILLKRKIWNEYCTTSNYFAHGPIGRINTEETIHINCPPVYSCYRYDSVCRDGLLVRESGRCHVVIWSNKHARVAPRASWRASVPVHSLSFQNFYGGICLYLCTIICKLVICRLSFVCYHCLEYVRLDDPLGIRKRLCCLLRVCVKTVVSILFWWFNKDILLLVSPTTT